MSDQRYVWLQQAKANGWQDILRLTLDTLEPFGALGAQVIWVLQPTLGVFVAHDIIRDFANALETPGGIAQLRAALDADTDTPPPTA